MKLQNFEPCVCDFIPTNILSINLWFFFHIFVSFMEKEAFKQFYGCFDYISWTINPSRPVHLRNLY